MSIRQRRNIAAALQKRASRAKLVGNQEDAELYEQLALVLVMDGEQINQLERRVKRLNTLLREVGE